MVDGSNALNAMEFYYRFIKEVYPERMLEDGSILMDVYKNGAHFTPVVINIINSIIDSIGSGYKHQNEYFRIDAVGWTSHYQDMENDPMSINIGYACVR